MAVQANRDAALQASQVHEPVNSAAFYIGAAIADVVLISVTAVLSRLVYEQVSGGRVELSVYLGTALLLSSIFVLLIRSGGGYDSESLYGLDKQIRLATISWFIAFTLTVSGGFLLKASTDLSRGAVLLFLGSGLVSLIARRVVWRIWLARAVASGSVRTRKAILLGSTEFRPSEGQLSALRRSGVEVVQSTSLPADETVRKAALNHVVASLRRNPVDEVIIALSTRELGELDAVAEHLRQLPLPLRLMPDVHLSRLARQRSRGVGAYALIDITRTPLSAGELACKRVLDLAIAATALVAVAPLLVVAFAAIRLDSAGPVLFRQSRRGFNGRLFKILKLRTMTAMEDGDEVVQATRFDSRVTRVGSWLRRTSIDELPQLWNVLRGEMSIVGPRPHAIAHDSYYDTLIENYAFRHHVKPGLTGWAQVNGFRGETPDVSLMVSRVDHDVWYISNWSLALDLRILLRTVTKLFAKNVY